MEFIWDYGFNFLLFLFFNFFYFLFFIFLTHICIEMWFEEREWQRGIPFVAPSSPDKHTTNTLTNKTKKEWVCCGFVAWQTHDEYQIICCIILQNFADLIKINHPLYWHQNHSIPHSISSLNFITHSTPKIHCARNTPITPNFKIYINHNVLHNQNSSTLTHKPKSTHSKTH